MGMSKLNKNLSVFFKYRDLNKDLFDKIKEEQKEHKLILSYMLTEEQNDKLNNISSDILNELLSPDVIVDFNNHFNIKKNKLDSYNNDFKYRFIKKDSLMSNIDLYSMVCFYLPESISQIDYDNLSKLFSNSFTTINTKSKEDTDIHLRLNLYNSFPCSRCGDSGYTTFNLNHSKIEFLNTKIDKKSNNLIFLNSKCDFSSEKNDPYFYNITIKIPSKKYIIANNLLPLIKDVILEDKFYDINNLKGMSQYAYFLEKYNIFYGMATNAGIELLKSKTKSEYLFALSGFDEENEIRIEEGKEELSFLKEYDENSLGHISLDLWAYMAMDYDLFIKLCSLKNISCEEALKRTDHVILELDNKNSNSLKFTSYECNDDVLFSKFFFGKYEELTL